MIGKLAIFTVGYLLGTRAGRERWDQIARLARWVAERDEARLAAGVALNMAQLGARQGLGLASDLVRARRRLS
ncbi:MAG TPA: hypothetical protein VFD01_03675 [Candidatus Dormibacteraeota bacterium]|jgi:hypothetical protein|nr:hypothetical protein [Candidatus Dormibacteraeota bacterium]